ncbi:antibiotic biosynthesis monooxygenase family protein [Mycolicibacterium stellerae]|uniref:antibiotic biosynthesis monooxygenase family protein n=1 Tax=Mycolicibacterium stellerae TaxID=2358193 RepID=UPI000F0B8C67|nr:antibiotic biosynthesis monooxygenase family protein [Mycolicibacterium stellerae]
MTTIRENSDCATLINVFTVDPQRADELATLLASATEDVMAHQPGFRSANIHLSTDRTRVVNYAQWDSAEAYQAMLSDATARKHMATAAALAVSFDPHLYTVESVHER